MIPARKGIIARVVALKREEGVEFSARVGFGREFVHL